MKKRILSLFLVLLMLLSALPMTALAGTDGCVVQQRVSSPRDGQTYQMKLNERDVGSFTFTKNGSGWSIRNGENKYLSVKDGKLALSGTADTAWTYRNGALSTAIL